MSHHNGTINRVYSLMCYNIIISSSIVSSRRTYFDHHNYPNSSYRINEWKVKLYSFNLKCMHIAIYIQSMEIRRHTLLLIMMMIDEVHSDVCRF